MAATVNHSSRGGGGEPNVNIAGGAPATGDSASAPNWTTLRHNLDPSLDWTLAEQVVLEELLEKHASEPSVIRYAKISPKLLDKTVRDVALRCRWMSERDTTPFSKSSQDATQSMVSMDSDRGISIKAIGGVYGQILERNAVALDQISANFSDYKICENIGLLCEARSNILSILNSLTAYPEEMMNMPPLPVKLDEDLATIIISYSILP